MEVSELMSVGRAAEYAGVTRKAIEKRVLAGDLQYVRVEPYTLIFRASLESLMAVMAGRRGWETEAPQRRLHTRPKRGLRPERKSFIVFVSFWLKEAEKQVREQVEKNLEASLAGTGAEAALVHTGSAFDDAGNPRVVAAVMNEEAIPDETLLAALHATPFVAEPKVEWRGCRGDE